MTAAPSKFDPASLDDSRRFVVVKDRPVFDSHEEKNARGAVVARFDKKKLEEIAGKCNAKDRRGQPCPLTLGHTRDGDDVPEKDQPPIVGYARQFRVRFSKELGRHVLVADFHIEKSKYAEAESFPRVSVERWADGVLDPIALLRKTPARPIPSWTYARAVAEVYGDGADGGGAVWRHAKRGKQQVVRYAMADFDGDEDDRDDDRDDTGEGRDDPTAATGAEHGDDGHDEDRGDRPEGDDGDPGGMTPERYAHHHACKECKACYEKSKSPDRNMAPAAAAGATDAIDPGKTMPDKHGKHGKPAESIADKVIRETKPAPADRHAREIADLKAQLAKLQASDEAKTTRYARSEADKLVSELEGEGYLLGSDEDRAELHGEFAGMIGRGDDAGVAKLYAKVRRTYQPDPTANRYVRVDDDPEATTGRPSRNAKKRQDDADAEEAMQYLRDHPEECYGRDGSPERAYAKALEKVREGRKK